MTATALRRYHRRRLIGLGVTSQQITGTVGSGLMTAAGLMATLGGPVGVVAGAITAAVGSLTILIGGMFKPDLTKIEATRIVNAIEAQSLKPLLEAWRALPAENKTRSLQAAFVETFNEAWAAVMRGCSNPALGTAGQACISDRAEGACHWTLDGQTPGTPGNCGNWFTWYRDPIANDPQVRPDPIAPAGSSPLDAVSGSFTSFFGSTGGGIPPALMVGGALVLLGLVVVD